MNTFLSFCPRNCPRLFYLNLCVYYIYTHIWKARSCVGGSLRTVGLPQPALGPDLRWRLCCALGALGSLSLRIDALGVSAVEAKREVAKSADLRKVVGSQGVYPTTSVIRAGIPSLHGGVVFGGPFSCITEVGISHSPAQERMVVCPLGFSLKQGGSPSPPTKKDCHISPYDLLFHLLKNNCCLFPLLVLKGIYHY